MEKIEVGGQEFEIRQINFHLKVAASPEMAAKIDKGEGRSFLKVMTGLIREVSALPLAYRQTPVFSFIILPRGKMFQTVTGCPFEQGMAGTGVSLDKDFPLTLGVDEVWFERGLVANMDIRGKIGLCHELAHIVHSHWFLRMNNEGFAELLPHYLMDLEAQNPQHQAAVLALREKELRTINDIDKHGIFSAEDLAQRGNTQERKGYISCYLWMLGYVKRLEKKYQLDKFGAVNLLLAEFARLDKLSGGEKDVGAAALAGVTTEVMLDSLRLQQEGQFFLRQKYGK